MTEDEQTKICKIITKACMWGHGGVGDVILEKLDKAFPMERSWLDVHKKNARTARHESVGVITTEEEIKHYLYNPDYMFCNYQPGELSIHGARGGGLYKYVTGPLADKYGKLFDSWNYRVYQERAKRGERYDPDEE